MIAHVVLFTPRSDLPPGAREQLVAAFEDALRRIPTIKRAHAGRRVTHGRPYEQLMTVDYQYAAILEFASIEDLQAYLNDPVHQQLATRFFATFQQALMYDYEMVEDASGLG